MSQKVLLAWALSATALMLVAVGFALGKFSARPPAETVPASAYVLPEAAATDGSQRSEGGAGQASEYVVPANLAGMPTEWRSEHDDEYRGYAILLDPTRRELIVEKCRHVGYIDQKSGEPIGHGWEFCDNVLWATLAQFGDAGVLAVDRQGRAVNVTLNPSDAGSGPRLGVEFAEHRMDLIPGSKNDLLQAIEADPEIRRQKDLWIRRVMAGEDAERQQDAPPSGDIPVDDDVPRYTLPGSG